MTFAEKLERLDAVLKRLEGEPLSLDEALQAFEDGVGLLKECRTFLDRAEQRVTLLTQDGEVPFGQDSPTVNPAEEAGDVVFLEASL